MTDCAPGPAAMSAAEDAGWVVTRSSYNPVEDGYYESLFALSNGRLGGRATVDFESGGGFPGFFHADVYGPSISVPNHLVNVLNPLFRTLTIDGMPVPITVDRLLSFRQLLDMQFAETRLDVVVAVGCSRLRLRVTTLLPAQYADVVVNQIEVESLVREHEVVTAVGIDWSRGNRDYGGIFDRVRLHHLAVKHRHWRPGRLLISAENVGTGQCLAAAVGVIGEPNHRQGVSFCSRFVEAARFRAYPGRPVRLDTVTVLTLGAEEEAAQRADARLGVVLAEGVQELIAEHRAIWVKRWREAAMVNGPAGLVEGLRYSQFQVLQAADRTRNDLAVAARGLTSEFHSGHHFVNTELFLVPYFAWTEPPMARALLRHRIRTLPAAQEFARATGFDGARYPSEADQDGHLAASEELRDVFAGRRWTNVSGREIVHNSGHILQAISSYLEATGDERFVAGECVPVIVACARFLADLMRWDAVVQGRGCRAVTGPNEFHHGIDHHFGTNLTARWGLRWAAEIIERLRAAGGSQSDIDDAELDRWRDVAREIYLPPARDGVFPAFAGYLDLPDRVRDERISARLPVPPAGPTGADQLTKQTDVVLSLILCRDLFDETDFRDLLAKNFAYYEPRTVHGSSLSLVHAAIAAFEVNDEATGERLLYAMARYNLDFQPRGGYINGVHLPACAGVWLTLMHGCFRLRARGGRLSIWPRLPGDTHRLVVPFYYRDQRVIIKVTDDDHGPRHARPASTNGTVEVSAAAANTSPVRLRVGDEPIDLAPGHRWSTWAPVRGRRARRGR